MGLMYTKLVATIVSLAQQRSGHCGGGHCNKLNK
jgi:hypothetical protein